MLSVLVRHSGGRLGRLSPAPAAAAAPANLQCRCYSLVTNDSQNRRRRDSRFVLFIDQKPSQTILKNFAKLQQSRNFSASSFRFQTGSVAAAAAAAETAATATSAASNNVTGAASSVVTDAAATTAASNAAVSAAPASTQEIVLDFLPEKPVPVDPTTILGEPSLTSLGLGSWWPSGRMQLIMEWIHIDIGLEWYQTIMLTTLCLRLFTFPFVVMAQKNVAKMSKVAPGMRVLQDKITEARQRGDLLEVNQLTYKLQEHMKKHDFQPFKNVIPTVVQLPIFMSMFFALRGMARNPVGIASLENGGILWFENLTMYDPFYALPIFMAVMMAIQLRIGAEGLRLQDMDSKIRAGMMALPLILLPFTVNMPSAVTLYWCSTNSISVMQALLLKIPMLRSVLGIPKQMRPDPKTVKDQPKVSFRESVRNFFENSRKAAKSLNLDELDQKAFQEAGLARAVKTYKYDPTKPVTIKPKLK